MPDDNIDGAAEHVEKERQQVIDAIRARATLEPGEPGDCSRCDEPSPRLVRGWCARCREPNASGRAPFSSIPGMGRS